MAISRPARHLVTLSAAAEYAAVSTKTIRRWIASGDLAGYRLGKRALRVDLNDLEALARPIPTTGPLVMTRAVRVDDAELDALLRPIPTAGQS